MNSFEDDVAVQSKFGIRREEEAPLPRNHVVFILPRELNPSIVFVVCEPGSSFLINRHPVSSSEDKSSISRALHKHEYSDFQMTTLKYLWLSLHEIVMGSSYAMLEDALSFISFPWTMTNGFNSTTPSYRAQIDFY